MYLREGLGYRKKRKIISCICTKRCIKGKIRNIVDVRSFNAPPHLPTSEPKGGMYTHLSRGAGFWTDVIKHTNYYMRSMLSIYQSK